MRKSYKILVSILLMIIVMISASCLATTGISAISPTSGDNTESKDIYVDNYEDYESIMNGIEPDYSQSELKEYYEEYQTQIEDYYNSYTREETVKAKVKKVSPVEEYYDYSDYYYTVTKYEFQPITVEVVEGKYIGQTFEIDYLLTGDSLGNIRYAKVHPGDTVFVAVGPDEATGELRADITNTGSNVDRFGIVVCLGIFVILVLVIYAGKKGVLISLITLLILDFCLVIIPNMGFMGEGFAIGTIGFILLLIPTVALYELGFNKKVIKGSLISIVTVIMTWFLLAAANYITRTVGIVFEVSALSENVILGNMNFENLYMMITLMIATIAITSSVCKTLKVSEVLVGKTFDEKSNECRDVVAANVLLLVVTLFATYIPNHLLLLTNKYTATEVWNSEILISELVRLFVLMISVIISVPVTILLTNEKEK